jgi:hypothetical protein
LDLILYQIKTIEDAVLLFENSALRHTSATGNDDFKEANKAYKCITSSVTFLRESKELLKLSDLLLNQSNGVRVWAASFLLAEKEKECIEVLEEISKPDGIISFDAKITLSEWRKENLKLGLIAL